jgi:hypothetical protein
MEIKRFLVDPPVVGRLRCRSWCRKEGRDLPDLPLSGQLNPRQLLPEADDESIIAPAMSGCCGGEEELVGG